MPSTKGKHTKAYLRVLCSLALACLLATVSLGAVPVCASLLADDPMPAWAGGIDEALADEGADSSAGSVDDSSANGASSAQANGADTQTTAGAAEPESASVSGASSAAASSQSGSASTRAASSDTPGNRGYVGPWYALNDDYVVQVEERFDAITEDEYAATVTRTALIVTSVVAVFLAVIMFARSRRAQARIRKRRR